MEKVKIKVIIGSTRQNRFSEKPARWIFDEIKSKESIEAELLDLHDYQVPFYDAPISPSRANGNYENEIVKKWAEKTKDGDAFIIVAPEYNHGPSAVLKNALDSIYIEWNNKAVGFVSYGSVGGARGVEQLRLNGIELQMAPIRNSIHIPWQVYMEVAKGNVPVNPALFESLKDTQERFFDQLMWWTKALKAARSAS